MILGLAKLILVIIISVLESVTLLSPLGLHPSLAAACCSAIIVPLIEVQGTRPACEIRNK